LSMKKMSFTSSQASASMSSVSASDVLMTKSFSFEKSALLFSI
jgi:hypothetical protein